MDKYPVIWGLDIGHSSIKAAKLSRLGNTVTVMGYAIAAIVMAEDGDRDEAVVKALQQLAQEEDFGNLPVIVSLSGRQIFSRTLNIPMLNPKKRDRMVELEARQQIPGNFDEIEWDYHLSPAADGASNDVALFAARRDITEELIRKCKRAGMNLVGVSVSSLALYNFVRFDQDFPEEETVIILDVGAENTDLVLYQGETLWMRSLALAGNDITNVFMKKFRVSFEEAETLKRQIGDSRQAEKILKVLEGTLNDLTGEVQRSLGFYKSQNPNAKLENIVISGNTFRLPSLPEYVAERMRYTVNILEDLDKIQVAGGIDRENFLRDLQSLGVAIGLGLQGVGVAKANVNLLPSTLELQRVLKTKRWAAVALIVLLAITFGVRTYILHTVIASNNEMHARIDKYYAEHKREFDSAEKVLGQVEPLALELQRFNTYGGRGLFHGVLENITDMVQRYVRKTGRVNKPGEKPPEEGGEPPLQAVYLVSIDFPPPSDKLDPFHPLSEVRNGKIELEFPSNTPAAMHDLHQALKDDLAKVPTPDYLHILHPDPLLFSSVMERSEADVKLVYYYINNNTIDNEGKGKKISEPHSIPAKDRVLQFTIAPVLQHVAEQDKPQKADRDGNHIPTLAQAKEAGK